MSSITCTVRIAGRDFTLTTKDAKEKTERVAAYVDRKMTELMDQTLASREVAAVICALSIAEELIDAQDENRRLTEALYQSGQTQERNE